MEEGRILTWLIEYPATILVVTLAVPILVFCFHVINKAIEHEEQLRVIRREISEEQIRHEFWAGVYLLEMEALARRERRRVEILESIVRGVPQNDEWRNDTNLDEFLRRGLRMPQRKSDWRQEGF